MQEFYYHRDRLGNITEITDFEGTVVQRYVYDAFGKVSIFDKDGNAITPESAKHLKSPYAFTGREYDPETGCYHYRNRYYCPNMARFISEESLGIDGPNLYWYGLNNPANFIDPMGDFAVGIELEAIGFFFPRGAGISGVGVFSIDFNPFSKTFLRTEVGILTNNSPRLGVGGAATAGVSTFFAFGNSSICDLEGESIGVSYGLGPSGKSFSVSSRGVVTVNPLGVSIPTQAFVSVDFNRTKVQRKITVLEGFNLFNRK